MADPFTILVTNLNSLGFFGFLLPFILVFTIVFALLEKSKWFDDKKIEGVLSLVVAFFAIGFGGPLLADFFVNLFGFGAVVLAGILIIVLFITMSGGDISKMTKDNKGVAAILVGVGLIVFFIALGAMGVSLSGSVFEIIFIVVFLAVAVMFVTK